MYVDTNPKTENWIKVDAVTDTFDSTIGFIQGTVININSLKGYAFFKPDINGANTIIPAHLVSKYSLCESMALQVEIEEYTDNRTVKLKKRVFKIEI
ncbi:MAG: hypothetical protein IPO98_18825 [Saprospiraceae bacterium]|nr:hypothetical protein [Saprospiraceae bacterium]